MDNSGIQPEHPSPFYEFEVHLVLQSVIPVITQFKSFPTIVCVIKWQ